MQDRELLELLDEMKIRIGEAPDELERPPADLWAGIEAQLNAEHSADGLTIVPSIDTPPAAETAEMPREQSVVTSLDHHRRKRRPAGILLAAVAASVVAAVAIGTNLGSNATVIDNVALSSLEDGTSFGDVTITEDDDGIRIDVDVPTELAAGDGAFYEIWVIDTEVNEMHSLGQIQGDDTFYLPDGVDVRDFPIIDISIEEDDGNAAHSGNSAYRGQLEA